MALSGSRAFLAAVLLLFAGGCSRSDEPKGDVKGGDGLAYTFHIRRGTSILPAHVYGSAWKDNPAKGAR